MNRETRKANLRKLKLTSSTNEGSSSANQPSPSSPRLLSHKDTNNQSEELSVSDFFRVNPQRERQPPTTTKTQPNKLKRQNLSTFVGKGPHELETLLHRQQQQEEKPKQRQSDDFEIPQKKIKRAPKFKRTTAPTKATKSRQPKIKSAFLRNEEAFSAITAQHCLADNFSPEDMQLALAISQSESETVCGHGNGDTPTAEIVIDLIGATGVDQRRQSILNTQDSIRTKLQKYGFRTAAKEDYNSLAASFLPKRRVKAKWASKFTALTLRDPEQQSKKLHNNIERFLARQYRVAAAAADDDDGHSPQRSSDSYKLYSNALKRCRPQTHLRCIGKEFDTLADYFVGELFEVSSLNAGHLLKDWSVIQGRDMSPAREGVRAAAKQMVLQRVYAELEQCFGQQIDEYVECETTFDHNHVPTVTTIVEAKACKSPMQSLVDSRAALESQLEVDNEHLVEIKETVQTEPISVDVQMRTSEQNVENICEKAANESFSLQKSPLVENKSSFSGQVAQLRSPDLFADSDQDTENSDEDCMNTFEIFSSSEDLSALDKTENIADVAILAFEEANEAELSADDVPAVRNIEAPIVDVQTEKESPPDEHQPNNIESVIDLTQVDFNIQTARKSNTPASDRCIEDVIDVEDYYYCYNQSLGSRNLTNKSISSPTLGACGLDKARKNLFANSPQFIRNKPQSPVNKANRSSSFTEQVSEASIDLTEMDDDNEGPMLSDDEVNYSIWRSDNVRKSLKPCNTENYKRYDDYDDEVLTISSGDSDSGGVENEHEISVLDLIGGDVTTPMKNASSPFVVGSSLPMGDANAEELHTLSQNSRNSDVRTPSPLLQTPPQRTAADILADASFIASPGADAAKFMKQCSKSLSTKKYNHLLTEISKHSVDDSDDDFDEFDRLVYGSNKKPSKVQQEQQQQQQQGTQPDGLDQLLTSKIYIPIDSMHTPKQPKTNTVLKSPNTETKENCGDDATEEIRINNRIYRARLTCAPKPDYANMSEAELLKHLYNFGIKPLKRKHAVTLLEYMYNQMHPIVLSAEDIHKSRTNAPVDVDEAQGPGTTNTKTSTITASNADHLSEMQGDEQSKLQLQDNFAHDLTRFANSLSAELPNEQYILQTNVTKKTVQPLVPLHVAWFNLVCANPALHEAIVMYEPIDLQQIYLYLKTLGYRYDPKDMKTFCDQRCIIFRYDLNANSNVRKRRVPSKKKTAGGSTRKQ